MLSSWVACIITLLVIVVPCPAEETCSILRMPWSKAMEISFGTILESEFPLIIHSPLYELPTELKMATSLDSLHNDHGQTVVVLSSSNAYSHGRVHSTLAEYLETFTGADLSAVRLGNSTTLDAQKVYYLFGGNYDGIWREITSLYEVRGCGNMCEVSGAKTVGVGAKSSGVAFHYHGPGFAEVIHGAKEWFFYPPEMKDVVDRIFIKNNITTAYFKDCLLPVIQSDDSSTVVSSSVCSERSTIDIHESDRRLLHDMLQQCTLEANELLYFPVNWMHATLNLGNYNVFISTFIDLQLLRQSA